VSIVVWEHQQTLTVVRRPLFLFCFSQVYSSAIGQAKSRPFPLSPFTEIYVMIATCMRKIEML
jgi:hypothetical protein